jgi:eukaryotic-like serine/threonine-protein kinase
VNSELIVTPSLPISPTPYPLPSTPYPMNPSSRTNPWIGRSLGDKQRYRLDSRLGAGGMGDVFLATDTRLGQQVALKLLKDTLVESPEMMQRFEHEIAICAALVDEHIVKIMDAGVTDEGYPFYVMEYLRGETLGELLRREKQLSIERTVKIISQVCNGLLLAHQGVALPSGEYIETVVHRDLKPDNIFLVPTDLGAWVKIVDFGIAKIRYKDDRPQTLTHTFLGTLRYSSPEQMMGDRDLDGRSDVYSLGVILYEMLSGADPFGLNIQPRQMSEASWVIAHTQGQPVPLRSQTGCEHLPPEIEAIALRCLEKTPDLRFGSVAELNLALQAVVSSSDPSIAEMTRDRTIVQPRPFIPNDTEDDTVRKIIVPPPKVEPESIVAPIPDSATIPRRLTPPDPVGQPIREQTTVQPLPTHPDPAEQTNPQPVTPVNRPIPDQTTVQPLANPVRTDRTQVQPRTFEQNHPANDSRTVGKPSVAPVQKSQTPWLKIAIGGIVGLGSIVGIYLLTQSRPTGITPTPGGTSDSTPSIANPEVTSLASAIKLLGEETILPGDSANLQAAIDLAAKISPTSPDAKAAKTLSVDAPQLLAGIKLASQGKLQQAIDLAKKIDPNSPLSKKAKAYIKEWMSV